MFLYYMQRKAEGERLIMENLDCSVVAEKKYLFLPTISLTIAGLGGIIIQRISINKKKT